MTGMNEVLVYSTTFKKYLLSPTLFTITNNSNIKDSSNLCYKSLRLYNIMNPRSLSSSRRSIRPLRGKEKKKKK